jgi:hypothetical protein
VAVRGAPARPSVADIYTIRHGSNAATRLGSASSVAPAANGAAVWLHGYLDDTHCRLRLLGLDGRVRQSGRPVPCWWGGISAGGQAGLTVRAQNGEETVWDPISGRTLLEAKRVVSVVGRFVLSGGEAGEPLAITDLRRGKRWRLRWPSRFAGMSTPAVDPGGRFIALSFVDPAYLAGVRINQVLDVWLLDLTTRALKQLPDMPALVNLKRTSIAWTHDRRLVVLTQSEEGNVIAIWRPGQDRVAVRPITLPDRGRTMVAW